MSLRQVQLGAIGLGYDLGASGADGKYGARTEAALRALIDNRGQPLTRNAPPPRIATPIAGRLFQGSARHPIDEIIVHCSDTRPDWMAGQPLAAKVAEIRRWHVEERKWRDIGYHYIIDRDGAQAMGRPESVIGAGVEGRNAGVIHIVLIGGHGCAATDPFDRNFTPAQDAALRRVIANISARTAIESVTGHNDWARKACPGFNVATWLNAT